MVQLYVPGRIAQRGISYIEIMISVGVTAIIMASLMGVMNTATNVSFEVRQRNEMYRDARFAMKRMVDGVSKSRQLLLPLRDNPNTNWPEHIREQTIPPSAPIGNSVLATAVLAVSLPEHIDLNSDGIPDADNDNDGLINEDPPGDITEDNAGGILFLDDDGDGLIDEGGNAADDDEYAGTADEDPLNGVDDDNDGSIDEDFSADLNGDGCSGLCGVDDDGDGAIDESGSGDDDEDGQTDEDFVEVLAFYLAGDVLKERMTVPWDERGSTQIDGEDFVELDIARNVSRFRVERFLGGNGFNELVDITLEITDPETGETFSVRSQVRIGGGL